jgi:ferredoxin--NADP+ reductase
LIGLEAPLIAKKAKPGQFIILRIDDYGERIPLTIYDYDREEGLIRLIFQEVGKTTIKLGRMERGDGILDVVGPLGRPMEEIRGKRVVCVGGGVGVVSIFPKARLLFEEKNYIISIIGAKSRDLVILEKEMRAVSNELYVTTDDGSYGHKGFVTDLLDAVLSKNKIDIVLAVGPLVMMKASQRVVSRHNTRGLVSLNSIMVDGTGMCGSCRVRVGGKMRFACCDGPIFDGDEVDFDELIKRQSRFSSEERVALKRYMEMGE